jgi:hypothetical protein
VIIFSSFYKDEHIFPAIRSGALSYLLKDARPEELVDAIHKAAAGEAVLDPKVAARIVQEMQQGGADRDQSFCRIKRTRNGSAYGLLPVVIQSGDCRAVSYQREDRQEPRKQYFEQTASFRSHSGGCLRLVKRHRSKRIIK